MDAIFDKTTRIIQCYTNDPGFDLGDSLERAALPDGFDPAGKAYRMGEQGPVQMTAKEVRDAGLDPEHNRAERRRKVQNLQDACDQIIASNAGAAVKALASSIRDLF